MLSIAADERAALHFDELASSLDAGLPMQAIGASGDDGDRAVHGALRQRGVRLSPSEDAILLAAWRAGRIGPALRGRAEQRRQRAAVRRQVVSGLAYPTVLLGMVVLACIATAPIVGHYYFAFAVAALVVLATVFTLAAQRGLRRGDERWTRMPLIGRLATDLAEIPYLETLQAMYGAGVPVVQAHETATAAVPEGAVRQRLRVAGRVLGAGHNLGEALATSLALNPDTRTLLRTGEQAGQLEDALQRALVHRREVSGRSLVVTARRGTAIVYGLAMALAVGLILTFLWRFDGLLQSLRR
ncbi:MAG: type II secretion system F family protein [Planctomycetes bacterium]|nr:type II secretion system F family protein [Planctomycetota bacterium]